MSIAIRKNLVPLVKKIHRIGGRAMEIRIKTDNKIQDISILNTYAPHLGYSIEVIKNYWIETNTYISLIPLKYIY